MKKWIIYDGKQSKLLIAGAKFVLNIRFFTVYVLQKSVKPPIMTLYNAKRIFLRNKSCLLQELLYSSNSKTSMLLIITIKCTKLLEYT